MSGGLLGAITFSNEDREEGKILAGYNLDKEGAFRYLKQELGVLLEENKNRSLADAISKPDKFIDKRTLKTNEATEVAADAFKKYMQKLLTTGVPFETAKNTATLHAKAIYDAEMNIYELANPGYATAIGSKMVVRDAQEGVKDLYLQDKAQRRAYKKKVIKKYKTKKAAKAAKGTPQ